MFENLRARLAYSLVPKDGGTVPTRLTESVISDTLRGVRNFNPPKRGSKELLDIYNESPWVRAIVNKVGKAVGDTGWRIYIAKDSITGRATKNKRMLTAPKAKRDSIVRTGIDINTVEEIVSHPLLELLDYGNEALLGKSVIQLTAQYIDLMGEAFWILERNGFGVPVAIWPVPPIWVRKTPNSVDPYYVIHGVYGTTDITIPSSEVIAFKDPDPLNPYGRGSGIVNSLGNEIEIDDYAAKHLKAFFYNRAKPDLIISGDSIGRDDTVRLEEKWLERHQGFMKAFKPMFMSKKVDVKELSQNLEHQQMVQLRQQERDTIMQTMGIPPEKLGVVSDSKRSTIASADLFWSKDVITPRAELIRATMQRELVPQFDDRILLDFDSPVAEDKEFILGVMQAEPAAFTLNDWRDLADFESFGPKGKVVLVPVNQDVVAVGDLKKPRPSQMPDNAPGSNPAGGKKSKIFEEDSDDKFAVTLKEISTSLDSGKMPKDLMERVKKLLNGTDKGTE